MLFIAANTMFCVMGGLIRWADEISAFKIAMFRFLMGMVLLGSGALFRKIELRFVRSPFLFMRGLTGGLAIFILCLSIQKLGIAKGTLIVYSFPIFASILGAIFLRERVGAVKAIAIACAFFGIYLLGANGSEQGAAGRHPYLYEAIAVFGALMGGTAVVFVKKLHDTDSTYAIYFSQCLFGLWIMFVPATLETQTMPGNPAAVAIALVSIGTLAAIGQLLMTEGYKYLPVAAGSQLQMMVPVLSVFIGIAFFKEAMTLYSALGAAIVIVACAVVIKSTAQPKAGPVNSEQ